MGAPSRERLVLVHAYSDGDFFENTRASQRVKGTQIKHTLQKNRQRRVTKILRREDEVEGQKNISKI